MPRAQELKRHNMKKRDRIGNLERRSRPVKNYLFNSSMLTTGNMSLFILSTTAMQQELAYRALQPEGLDTDGATICTA